MREYYFFYKLNDSAIRKRLRKAEKKYICAGTLMLAVTLTSAFGSVSVLAETVSGNQMPGKEVQDQELYEETELTLSGYCGAENENGGKNVTYIISDSDNDGIYDLLEIKGNGAIRNYNPEVPSPWCMEDDRIKIDKAIIKEGVTRVGLCAFRNCNSLKEIEISDDVTEIGAYAFYGCSSLKEIRIPESITKIDQNTFTYCISLVEIEIPKGVKEIGWWSFEGCRSLEKINIPESVTEIGGAFAYCSSLVEINIPEGVTEIGNDAFYGCSALKEITIPYSVTDISFFVEPDEFTLPMFGKCSALRRIFIPEKENLMQIYIPDSASEIRYLMDEGNKVMITGIKIGEGQTLAEIPDKLYEYPIVSVAENFRSLVSEEGHTHKYSETGICQICNKSKEQDEGAGIDVDIPEGPDTWKSKEGVEGFVFRLYNVAMNRDADEAGFNDWNTRLNTGKETAAEVARGFVLSDEFKNFGYNDVQYVKLLYRTMFGREADEGGLNDWLSKLENGMSREYVFRGFAESQEFTNLCNSFDVERGSVNLNQYRDKNEGATGFVARLYTKMLGRGFDDDGLEYWCRKYLTGEETIEQIASDGFLHSKELDNQDLSDEEFVTRMYRTFLNREPDEAGLADWINRLKTGRETRDSLVYGFTLSKEFGNIKASYGL